MPLSTTALLLLSAAAARAASPSLPERTAEQMGVQLAQVTIEQRVIIRIPAIPVPPNVPESRSAVVAPPVPPAPVAPLREMKGPKCLKLGDIRGAVISREIGITMVTDGDEQFRAHFGRSCRAADFYSGFYIEPNKDGALCAGRDMLHARNGANCDIEKFSKLVPED